jgi:hypothetical protein
MLDDIPAGAIIGTGICGIEPGDEEIDGKEGNACAFAAICG